MHISAECGRGAQVHDCPIFDVGDSRRPADWLEAESLCCDATLVSGGAAAARMAEDAKRRKYAAAMASHPGLRFSPFGVASDGAVGPSAQALMTSWAASLARRRRAAGDLPGQPALEVQAAVGRAFATAMAFHAAHWLVGPSPPYRPPPQRRVPQRVAPPLTPLPPGRTFLPGPLPLRAAPPPAPRHRVARPACALMVGSSFPPHAAAPAPVVVAPVLSRG